nr:integrase core domain-containing protein [Spirochaetaceae bacterium]
RWSFKHKKRGRKPVTAELKKLILEMKTDNPLWGCRRISDELKKLDINIHHTTVNKIIQTFRKEGKIQPSGNWKKFLKSHWDSLFAMDFMTIDYSWYGIKGVNICIAAPKAGRKQAFCSPLQPGMNAYVERLNGTIRREALDHFLLFSEKQVRKIIKEYVEYYNYLRPHQGIDRIPAAKIESNTGIIKKERILGGLHHHYFRSSA